MEENYFERELYSKIEGEQFLCKRCPKLYSRGSYFLVTLKKGREKIKILIVELDSRQVNGRSLVALKRADLRK